MQISKAELYFSKEEEAKSQYRLEFWRSYIRLPASSGSQQYFIIDVVMMRFTCMQNYTAYGVLGARTCFGSTMKGQLAQEQHEGIGK